MSKKQREKVRELKNKSDYQSSRQSGEKKMNVNAKRCPHCGHEMRARGSGDAAGGYSWKCRNKKCGRRVWKRREVTPPEPLVPSSLMSRFR